MHIKIKLFLAFSAFLLTMCRSYNEVDTFKTVNGLSCRTYTDYFGQGLVISDGLECSYTCPNGKVEVSDFEGDPSFSATKRDLDRLLCGVAPQFTPTNPPARTSPTPAASPSPTALASPTVENSPTARPVQPPLLTGEVPMCDLGTDLMNLRIVKTAPDLTGKTLTVQISDIESTCAVNTTNPSLLSCTIPASVTFPARVLVSVDGAVVNDFIYDGLGCTVLDTPVPHKGNP